MNAAINYIEKIKKFQICIMQLLTTKQTCFNLCELMSVE